MRDTGVRSTKHTIAIIGKEELSRNGCEISYEVSSVCQNIRRTIEISTSRDQIKGIIEVSVASIWIGFRPKLDSKPGFRPGLCKVHGGGFKD